MEAYRPHSRSRCPSWWPERRGDLFGGRHGAVPHAGAVLLAGDGHHLEVRLGELVAQVPLVAGGPQRRLQQHLLFGLVLVLQDARHVSLRAGSEAQGGQGDGWARGQLADFAFVSWVRTKGNEAEREEYWRKGNGESGRAHVYLRALRGPA